MTSASRALNQLPTGADLPVVPGYLDTNIKHHLRAERHKSLRGKRRITTLRMKDFGHESLGRAPGQTCGGLRRLPSETADPRDPPRETKTSTRRRAIPLHSTRATRERTAGVGALVGGLDGRCD